MSDREIRYDPDALRRALKKCEENIKLYERYIEDQKNTIALLEADLERELKLREKEQAKARRTS
jgi:hypothetical protein